MYQLGQYMMSPMVGFMLVWMGACCSFFYYVLETDTYDF